MRENINSSIKERARNYATQRVGGEYIGGFKGDTWLSLYQTYIEIATEQRKIDIANACEAYCNVVCQAEQTSGKRCYWRVQNERCPKLESFIKIMEDNK
ncbi:MAG: hypothetical protein MJZ98_00545 [Paludibacteraceae bacterium]|nr:hypothetical protein [Paludibacteraceae bacterium]